MTKKIYYDRFFPKTNLNHSSPLIVERDYYNQFPIEEKKGGLFQALNLKKKSLKYVETNHPTNFIEKRNSHPLLTNMESLYQGPLYKEGTDQLTDWLTNDNLISAFEKSLCFCINNVNYFLYTKHDIQHIRVDQRVENRLMIGHQYIKYIDYHQGNTIRKYFKGEERKPICINNQWKEFYICDTLGVISCIDTRTPNAIRVHIIPGQKTLSFQMAMHQDQNTFVFGTNSKIQIIDIRYPRQYISIPESPGYCMSLSWKKNCQTKTLLYGIWTGDATLVRIYLPDTDHFSQRIISNHSITTMQWVCDSDYILSTHDNPDFQICASHICFGNVKNWWNMKFIHSGFYESIISPLGDKIVFTTDGELAVFNLSQIPKPKNHTSIFDPFISRYL